MRKLLDLSPNYSNIRRPKGQIKYVILHYTGMQSEIESRNRLKSPKSKVSCHYLIGKTGRIIQMVNERNIAWHAGESRWKSIKNLNPISIGIELVNKGHRFGYEKFPNLQIKSLIKLCKKLKFSYGIKKNNFLGHSDIAPLRKIDPGEKFPWKKLSNHSLGIWYKLNKKKIDIPKDHLKRKNLFFNNLYKLGYRYFKKNKRAAKDKMIITAFQRKFTPKNISGKIDVNTLKISHFLTKKS